MALTTYDQRYLSPEQQDQIKKLTTMWGEATTEEQRQSINITANAIRESAGYTGGTTGEQFKVTDESLFNANQAITPVVDQGPEAPFIDPDNFSMRSLIQPIYDIAQQAPPSFDEIMESDYYKSLEESIMTRAGKTAETVEQRIVDQMVSRGVLSSSMTAKDISDAVSSVYAEAQSELIGEVTEIQKNQLQLRQDQISNLLSVADLAMTEYQYRISATQKEKDEAWERTKVRGYVDNEDAIILGLEPSTLSEDARKRNDELDEYLRKQQMQLDFAKKEIDYRRESDIAEYQAKADVDEGSGADGKVTEADYKDIMNYTDDFFEAVESDRYLMSTEDVKANTIHERVQTLIELLNSGSISEYAYKQIMTQIERSTEYKEDYVGYVEKLESFETLHPGRVLDR